MFLSQGWEKASAILPLVTTICNWKASSRLAPPLNEKTACMLDVSEGNFLDSLENSSFHKDDENPRHF